MTHKLVAILAILFAGGLSAPRADAAALRPQAVIEGTTVRLGDLVSDAGDAAAVIVAPAPRPGERMILSASEVARIAAAHGLGAVEIGGLTRIAVTRTGKSIPQAVIVEAIRDELTLQGVTGRKDVRLIGVEDSLVIPVTATPSVTVDHLSYDPAASRFTATILLPADEGVRAATVAGRILEVASIPVLNRALAKGDIISEADIGWLDVPPSRAGQSVITDDGQLIGLSAVRPLRPGQPIRSGDVREPVLVEKGALINLVVVNRFMTLSSLGKALDSGGEGDPVRVINIDSNRTVQGVVAGANEVQVGGALRLAAASRTVVK